MKPEDQEKLRKPFETHQVGKLPRSGTQLDYVGHAAVTDRLLQVDPDWNWAPITPVEAEAFGLPSAIVRNQNGQPIEMWIKLTVAGITRYGVGTVAPGAFEATKQLIGDALRNAAMRFGVALDLWSKEELSDVPPEAAPKSGGQGTATNAQRPKTSTARSDTTPEPASSNGSVNMSKAIVPLSQDQRKAVLDWLAGNELKIDNVPTDKQDALNTFIASLAVAA